MGATATGTEAAPATRLMLPGAGFLVGAWAIIPPYIGPKLNVTQRVEIADHVVPGVLVLALSVDALVAGSKPRASTFMFLAGLGVVLAGLWMTATHVPLVPQMLRDEAEVGAVVYHSSPGLAVLALGAAWAFAFRAEPDDGGGEAAQTDR